MHRHSDHRSTICPTLRSAGRAGHPLQRRRLSRLFLAALAGTGALAGAAGHAGEISLFEAAGFGGRVVTLRASAPSVSNVGFNDRTSSIVVRAGRWEVCSDDDFRGDCAIFEAGQYPSLDGRFDKRVSSAREVDVVGANGSAPAVVGGINGNNGGNSGGTNGVNYGAVDVYGQANFRGRTVRVDQGVNNFNDLNFNDRTSSLVVQGSTWELCTDSNFRGTCRTFVPGRYPTLGYGMDRSISSARPVVQQAPPPVVHGGGWDRGRRDDAGDSPVVLFSNDGIRGRSIAIGSDMADLSSANFNDAAQSMVIESGFWEFCSDSYYRGTCRVLGPGQYSRLEPALYRSVSSIRAARGGGRDARDQRDQRDGREGRGGSGGGRGDVELFTGVNFSGDRYPIRRDMTTFEEGGFNDRIGSVIVREGQWQMCVDANFRGSCTVFGPGRYAALGGLTNQLSSIRRID